MARTSLSKKKNSKRGLSTVVTTLLIILLSVVAVGMVWVFASNMIKKNVSNGQSCYQSYSQVTINGDYTCYNSTSGELILSLSMGDATVDKVIVSVSSASAVNSYTITTTPGPVPGLTMYPSRSAQVVLPSPNSGLTYDASGFTSKIDSIQVAPSIGGNQCAVSDSVTSIEDCSVFV